MKKIVKEGDAQRGITKNIIIIIIIIIVISL